MNGRIPVLAYYYCGWTRGRAIDEWQLLDRARPHDLPWPSQPRAGAYDCAEEEVLAGHIEEAIEAGVDGFVFCWYWDNGVVHLRETLDTLRRVVKRFPGFRYGLLWVNRRPHDHLPIRVPDTPSTVYEAFNSRRVRTGTRDLRQMLAHCRSGPFRDPAYFRIEGKPFFAVFSVSELLACLDRSGRAYLKDSFSSSTHLVCIAHGVEHWLSKAADLGFKTASSYVLMPWWEGPRRQRYATASRRAHVLWGRIASRSGLAYAPSICAGWNALPRGQFDTATPKHFPWSPVVSRPMEAEFRAHSTEALRYAEHQSAPYVIVASWNEWTEGHAIEPARDPGALDYLGILREVIARIGVRRG